MKEVIALEPENYGNSITLAALYWNTKQEPKGREVLDNLVAAVPADEDRRLDVARFYLSRGAAADAEKLLQEGIRLNAKTFHLRFALADVYRNTGRSEQAVAVLNECLALEKDRENPDILTTLNALAKVHLERREVDKAKGYADEVVKASPKERGRPPGAGEPGPSRRGRRGSGGGIPHGGRRRGRSSSPGTSSWPRGTC